MECHLKPMENFKPYDSVVPNFDFAFDCGNFSDAVLMIVIDGDVEENLHDDCFQKAKHQRKEKINNSNHKSGEGDAEPLCSPQDNDNSDVARSRSIFVCSALLAAKSLFFYKLFTCMPEVPQHQATVHIDASEEDAFMDLLKYVYSGKLTLTEVPSIINVLIAADKFGVVSCMSYCCKLLLDLPMTLESALLYLDLPPVVGESSCCRLLTETAKAYLVSRYSDMEKLKNEADDLSLVAIEAILCRNELRVASEDVVYDFVLDWVRSHYSEMEDRSKIFKSHLSHVIRFPSMTGKKLMEAFRSEELEDDVTRKFIMEALLFKTGSPFEESELNLDVAKKRRFTQRWYNHQMYVVFLDFRREELECLLPLGQVCSPVFHLGEQEFFVSAKRCWDPQGESHCFGLFLHMQEGRSPTVVSIDYEFAAKKEPTRAFTSVCREFYNFAAGKTAGCTNLFKIPWSSFISHRSLFFIDDNLHLRAELTVRYPQLLRREKRAIDGN